MALIVSADFDDVLGNVIKKDDYTAARILPFAATAEKNWLLPEIGKELYDAVVSFQNGNIGNLNSADYTELIEVMKPAIVWATYFEYLPYSSGTDSGNGLTEDVGDGSKPMRMSMIEKRTTQSEINLGKEIDRLMAYLFTNRSKFSIWSESVVGQSSLSLFVRSGVELGKSLPESMGSYWLWKRMRQNFVQKTATVLEPILGAPLFEKLAADLLADSLVTPYKQLRHLCSNYISYWVYAYILPTMVVGFDNSGALRVLSKFDGINNSKTPTENEMKRLIGGLEVSVKDAYVALIDYLKNNADDLPDYVLPDNTIDKINGVPRFLRNETKKRVFGM